ncbi:recombinase family protein [Flavobacterium sp. UBA7663]|uniref:recombinase family protein n=1 Tax=Flavobacterium sp. UBA7663 TaxID=1946557 RepID=UPI0025BD5CC9|nr:recombinase family protein [Flavobacterium sp. UBA7663]
MNKNVLLYVRVSTDEQSEGFSLNYQEESLKRFCGGMGFNIVKVYREDHSAKDFSRPQWKELRSFAKANRKIVDKVLFAKWDRFSRNIEQALTEMRLFDSMGIELNASEQYLDMSNCDNKMVLSIYLTAGEVERDKISSRTKSGTYQAKREGYYANRAPFGYDSFRDGYKSSRGMSKGKRSILKPNENAHFVTKAFKMVAMNIESVETTRRKLQNEGMKLEKSSFNRLLKNIVYAGKIEVPEYKKEPAMIVDGKHEPLIDLETYNKVQEVYRGKKFKGSNQSCRNKHFPLRDFLICEICGKQITGSLSTGRSKKYAYYHCREKCKTRVSTEQANINVASLFTDLQINDNIKELFMDILKDSESQINGDRKGQLKIKIERKKVLLEQLDKADDMRLANELPSDRYKSIIDRYNTELININMEIEALQCGEDSIKEYISSGIELLVNLDSLFAESDYEGKRIMMGSLFNGKLLFGNSGCRTTTVNEVINVLIRNNRELREIKNGQTVNKYNLSVKVQITSEKSNEIYEELLIIENLRLENKSK